MQVKNLKEKREIHDEVLKKSEKKAEEAASLAAEEAARCNAAVEIIKSLDILVSPTLLLLVMFSF